MCAIYPFITGYGSLNGTECSIYPGEVVKGAKVEYRQ